jgi:hypothetical protein
LLPYSCSPNTFKETTMEAKPNKEQTRKILEAIAECNRYIAKEEPRPADTRPEWAKNHLAFCKQHRAKLLAKIS